MYLLALPDDVLEKILSCLSYDEISHCRLVCQRFNEISKRMLNHGFHKVEKYQTQCLKRVRSQLPRRESERRNHPLARHCDILTGIETRLSLLGMTFKKFIEMGYCCFIPGKVLDEIYKLLRYVTTEQSPIRVHEVMQELRDLSSMAMEHFDDKIAPGLRKNTDIVPTINIVCSNSIRHIRSIPQLNIFKDTRYVVMAQYINKIIKRHNKLERQIAILRGKKKKVDNTEKRLNDLEQFKAEATEKLAKCEKTINEQQLTIANQVVQINEQELKIEKLNKLLEDKQEINYTCDQASDPSQLSIKNNTTVHTVNIISNAIISSKHKFLQDDNQTNKRIKNDLLN